MHDQSTQQLGAALDNHLDCLLREELAALRWSQTEVETFCQSPLPALVKQIVVSTLAKTIRVEKQREANGRLSSAGVPVRTEAPRLILPSGEH